MQRHRRVKALGWRTCRVLLELEYGMRVGWGVRLAKQPAVIQPGILGTLGGARVDQLELVLSHS